MKRFTVAMSPVSIHVKDSDPEGRRFTAEVNQALGIELALKVGTVAEYVEAFGSTQTLGTTDVTVDGQITF